MQYVRHLAEASGVHKQTIHELESGKRSPRQDTLQALRAVLPDLRLPLEVSQVGGADPRDPNGYAVHLPMDPAARALMLSELLQQALREQAADSQGHKSRDIP